MLFVWEHLVDAHSRSTRRSTGGTIVGRYLRCRYGRPSSSGHGRMDPESSTPASLLLFLLPQRGRQRGDSETSCPGVSSRLVDCTGCECPRRTFLLEDHVRGTGRVLIFFLVVPVGGHSLSCPCRSVGRLVYDLYRLRFDDLLQQQQQQQHSY